MLTKAPANLSTLKGKRGRFFENLEGTFYKSIFNPNVSGIKVVNAVMHLRVIERLLEIKLKEVDRATNRKQHLIMTHANRVLTALLLGKECGISKATELVTPNEEHLSAKLDFLFEETEGYIEQRYTNAYPARFFANVEKVGEIINYLADRLDS